MRTSTPHPQRPTRPGVPLSDGRRSFRDRHRARWVALAALLVVAAAIAGCGSSSSSSNSSSSASGSSSNAAASGTTLRVGDQAGTGAEALLSAAGLLSHLPFKVNFADFTSGPPMLQALSAGSLDVGGVGDAPPVFAAAGGAKLAIVGAASTNVNNAALLVPKNSSITSISQLKGKKIAVAQGSSADYHILTVLNKAGLSTHDVTLEYLQPAQALAAFSSGSVDAWDVWAPFIQQAVAQDGAKILVNGKGYGSNYTYVVGAKSSISDPTKAAEIKQYLKLLDQARIWADAHPQAWATTWAKATGLPVSVMLTAAKQDTSQPVPVDSKINTAEQSLVAAFSKAALIPKSYDFSPYIYSGFNSSVGGS